MVKSTFFFSTLSLQNHAVERLWVEINCRTNYPIKRALVNMENDGVIDLEDEVTKFCVSWVTRQVVEVGIQYTVDSWNSHPIPGNDPSFINYQRKRILKAALNLS